MSTETLSAASSQSLSLAGTWHCRLDPEGTGRQHAWMHGFDGEAIVLPGSLDTNALGIPNPDQDYLGGLSRRVKYVGAAWYTTEVELPEAWRGTNLELFLERVHWFSEVWVDGTCVGQMDSLSVPHRFVLQPTTSARVRIVVCVDNTVRIPIGRIGHGITDWTQTNWNGIIGRIELRPLQTDTQIRVVPSSEELVVSGHVEPHQSVRVNEWTYQADGDGKFHGGIPRGEIVVWSDSSPNLHPIEIETPTKQETLVTGFRTIAAEGACLKLNGQPTFLRGTLECCVFPKTGFPPMDAESWRQVMGKVCEYGLNHVRFHSWCPPEAAFVAADELGVLLQVELPLWTGNWPLSSDANLLEFCGREAEGILRTYGHHPSFVLFTLGNEMAFYGPEPEVDGLLQKLKVSYPHILMNFSSHGTHLSPECDFYVQADNAKSGAENRPLRGSTWFGVGSRFDRESPTTTTTCDEGTAAYDRPVVSHEVGEWAVFPNVNAADSYDGVLEARNFRRIQHDLAARGMADQADDFTFASGRLSAALYKEEIETLLRTRDLAGYQLLGLNDFPGQGTATIGMLDAFWQDKGFVTGAEFSEFCAPTVPLMITSKRVWRSDENLEADIWIFHSGEAKTVSGEWTFGSHSGQFPNISLVAGAQNRIGTISIPLGTIATPAKVGLTVTLSDGSRNHWDLWIFSAKTSDVPLPDVDVFGWFREDVRAALKAGRKVWLRLHPDRAWAGIPGRFAPAFWSPIHFKEQVGTMGTLIQADHPLFAQFPTERYSEWHWWEILTRSKSLVLDALPASFRPTLQVIDRYERNHKLGTMFEAQVGPGRIFVSFIDFDTPNRPAAAQLEASIRAYLASEHFSTMQSLEIADLDAIFADQP